MESQSEQDIASKSSIDSIIGESRGARNEITAESLTTFLKAQNGISDDVFVSDVRSVGENAGASSGSLIFEGVFSGGAKARYLIKYDPQSPMAPFHQYDMAAQYHVQQALHESGVLTPKPLWFDADGSMLGTPGYVMEFIEAESPAASAYTNGLMADAAPARRTAMTVEAVTALASMHDVDWVGQKLDFLLRRAAGETSISRDINWILDMVHYNQMHDKRIERAAAKLIADQPQGVGDVLIHGDSKFDNFLFVDDKVIAVIDFENSTIAPREHDLAYNVFTSECMSWGLERPDGFLSEEEMCAAYEKASGHQLRHWDYFMKLNRFKFSAFILSYTARMPGVQEQNPDFYAYFWDHIEKLGG